MSRSARENCSGATGAIWVVNWALGKGFSCGAADGAWNPNPVNPVAGCWNGVICCCCCCCCCWGWEENGVEKREEPNDDVEGVPNAGVEDGVPNAGVEDGVPKAGAEGWAPNIVCYVFDEKFRAGSVSLYRQELPFYFDRVRVSFWLCFRQSIFWISGPATDSDTKFRVSRPRTFNW